MGEESARKGPGDAAHGQNPRTVAGIEGAVAEREHMLLSTAALRRSAHRSFDDLRKRCE